MSRPLPELAIVSFHEDEQGHWVAELACGHAQHVRHRPPMESRPWVVTEEGRRGRLGAMLPCPLCVMPRLPDDAREYKRTADFDGSTVPKGLLATHKLKADTWGEIVVVAGNIVYVLEGQEELRVVLRIGVNGVIAPGAPHHVEIGEGGRFFVRFLKSA